MQTAIPAFATAQVVLAPRLSPNQTLSVFDTDIGHFADIAAARKWRLAIDIAGNAPSASSLTIEPLADIARILGGGAGERDSLSSSASIS